MNGVQYYRKYTMEQLLELQQQIFNDPACKNPDISSCYIYSAKARKQLDAIGWAISYHMKDQKAKV